jgi:hypothetical protein
MTIMKICGPFLALHEVLQARMIYYQPPPRLLYKLTMEDSFF